jgi:subtilase family serine protease
MNRIPSPSPSPSGRLGLRWVVLVAVTYLMSVTAVAATSAAGATAETGTASASTPGASGAGATSVVRACPTPAPGWVTCFAELRVPAHTGTAPAASPAGYGPSDLRSAYALPTGMGAGRTVAIVDAYDNPTVEADLAVYRAQYGLPPCTEASGCLTVVNQTGAAAPLPTTDAGWAVEISLDLDMVSAACPDCHLLLVEANSNGIDDMSAAVDTAASLGAVAISNSYGGPEFAAETQYESHYRHPGHAVVASSGDAGYGAMYPAASAYVTAVGGTTLQRSGTSWAETVWPGSGSGCSAYIAKPSWQNDAHCPMRMMNDISAVADPNTGVAVYTTTGQSGWLTVGGTSASAPLIAAMYAMTASTGSVEGGEAPWLRHGAGDVRDVTSGTNVPGLSTTTCGGDYLCTAAAGYDGPTGWGTPQGLSALTK